MKNELTPAAFSLRESEELEARCAAKRAQAKTTRRRKLSVAALAAGASLVGLIALASRALSPAAPTSVASVSATSTTTVAPPVLTTDQKAQCVADDVQPDLCYDYLVALAEIEYNQMQQWRRGG